MATKKQEKKDMALGLGKYYQADRTDLWGRVDNSTALNGMAASIDPASIRSVARANSQATSSYSDTASSSYSAADQSSQSSSFLPQSNASLTPGLGLNSAIAKLAGTGVSMGLSSQGVPFGGVLGSIAGAVLGEGLSGNKLQESIINKGAGMAIGAINPIAGLLYKAAESFGLINVGQGLMESQGVGMEGTAPGYGGGYFGKKALGSGVDGSVSTPDFSAASGIEATSSPSIPAGYFDALTGIAGALGDGVSLGARGGLEQSIDGITVSFDTPTPGLVIDGATGMIVTAMDYGTSGSETVRGTDPGSEYTGYSPGSDYSGINRGDYSNPATSYGGWGTASDSGDSNDSGD